MSAPVPKPRARYKISRDPSTESNIMAVDKPEENYRNPGQIISVDMNCSRGTCEKFIWSVSLPLTPSASVDEEMKNLTEIQSDSSSDECPLTPASPKSDQTPSKAAGEHSYTDKIVPHVANVQCGDPQSTDPLEARVAKKPRAATIRVSRRKQSPSGLGSRVEGSIRESAVARSSWLDFWKGRKHNVLWATFDGQLMSLWKKRSDKFTEYVFHVSSISSVRQQDKGRFSIYFRKKHFEFMAHSEAVQVGWVSSLHASRGQDPPAPPEQHGSLVLKEQRSKVYAAICGYNLWIYNSKEDFTLGLGMTIVSMNVASVKQTGRHSFSLITPYKTFNFSADSSREMVAWLGSLNAVILSALSCSEVALRLWASPWNKVCGDCGSPNPEWASINLLLVICEACAGVHRSLGSNRSKVRSLKLDSKVWTEPLVQLFVIYGNKAANNVWGHNIPAAEQILPNASRDQRAEFIYAKYQRGQYRRGHPLACSQTLLNKRLGEVVHGADVEETLSLLCSGAKVLNITGDPHCLSAITLAENAGQALQTELLRHNEFVEAPDFDQQRLPLEPTRLEELHGKLDDERFLFSQENESAACDVLDLREVISIFDLSSGNTHEFEVLTLTDSLKCSADARDSLLSHMLHIIRVVLPGPLTDEELEGVLAVSRVSLLEGAGLQHVEVWALLRPGQLLICPLLPHALRRAVTLSQNTHYNLRASENIIEVTTAGMLLYLQFEREQSCSSWFSLLPRLSSFMRNQHQSMYQLPSRMCGSVPPEVERCISHITLYGLKVEGLYRCCGTVTKITQLVEELHASPTQAILGTNEGDVLDVAGALKQLLRQSVQLIPASEIDSWAEAAAHTQETKRLEGYRRLVKHLPLDNRATLAALCGHLYLVQLHSLVNRMTAHNLAVVFAPTLFQELAMSSDMVRLTKELLIHHTLVFLNKEEDLQEEELITVF
ncbi:arf-GAP with Rho-GAP domain, ANK repeat and PH domain-containing protein 1 isoform X2 [Electrophorus electricus]|uniref:arf-GAP with Rho-GAP domain, ANK repeat and PH domain-containing protein 1 isoform X2 n=1 Tax=Electrophorus electricus TaxID=8005 RepID=UPI0015CFF6E1|nr:arf-GAP with Rho-GAP domain, ANK repeat and PH domain-containing protein 1 isoform X2 [Electrophorus electricus]